MLIQIPKGVEPDLDIFSGQIWILWILISLHNSNISQQYTSLNMNPIHSLKQDATIKKKDQLKGGLYHRNGIRIQVQIHCSF